MTANEKRLARLIAWVIRNMDATEESLDMFLDKIRRNPSNIITMIKSIPIEDTDNM